MSEFYKVHNPTLDLYLGNGYRGASTKTEAVGKSWANKKLAQNACNSINRFWIAQQGKKALFENHYHEGTWEVVTYELVRKETKNLTQI